MANRWNLRGLQSWTAVPTIVAMLACAANANAQTGNPIGLGSSDFAKRHGVVPYRMNGNLPTVAPACNSPLLSYFGGPVISDVQVVSVFWNSNVQAEIASKISSFYSDALSSTWFASLSEYSTTDQWIGPGAASSATTIVPTKCPASVTTSCNITDADLQYELGFQIANTGKLPPPQQDGAGNTLTTYMVYFPANVNLAGPNGIGNSCSEFCAYHSTATYAGSVALPYGAMMDTYTSACSLGCGAGATALEITTEISSHELAEIVTDPDVGLDTQAAFAYPAAWADNNNNCGEVADICDSGGTGVDITVAGRTWLVQHLWSNHQGACVASEPTLAGPTLTVSAQPQATVGTSVMFAVTANNPAPPSGAGGTFTSYANTVHFTSSDPNATLPDDFSFTPGDQGTANFMATLKSAGLQTISATDTLNGGIAGTSNTISIDGTSLSTLCPKTFVENQSTAITASVSSGASPTGSVDFKAGATVLCSPLPLSSGSATCQTPTLAVQGAATSSVYAVVASYSGDGGNSPNASAPLPLTVLKASDVPFRSGFEPNIAGCPTL